MARKWPKGLKLYENFAKETSYVYNAFEWRHKMWGKGFPKPDAEDGSVAMPMLVDPMDLFVYIAMCEELRPGYMKELIERVLGLTSVEGFENATEPNGQPASPDTSIGFSWQRQNRRSGSAS